MAEKTTSVVSFLREKAEIEKQSRDEELKLRREQLSLERELFELEKKERIQKLEYEKQQSKMMLEIIQQVFKQVDKTKLK